MKRRSIATWSALGRAILILAAVGDIVGMVTGMSSSNATKKTYSAECELTFEFNCTNTSAVGRSLTTKELVYIDSTWAHYYNNEGSDMYNEEALQVLDVVFYEEKSSDPGTDGGSTQAPNNDSVSWEKINYEYSGSESEDRERRKRSLQQQQEKDNGIEEARHSSSLRKRTRLLGSSRKMLRGEAFYTCSGDLCLDEGAALVDDGVGRNRRRRGLRDSGLPQTLFTRGSKEQLQQHKRRRLLDNDVFFKDFCLSIKNGLDSELFSGLNKCGATCDIPTETSVTQWIAEHYFVTDDPPPPAPQRFYRENHDGMEDCSKIACNQCEGDCDKDSDCKGTLVCSKRSGWEEVPGCGGVGGPEDVKGVDFCIAPEDAITNSRQLGQLQPEQEASNLSVLNTYHSPNSGHITSQELPKQTRDYQRGHIIYGTQSNSAPVTKRLDRRSMSYEDMILAKYQAYTSPVEKTEPPVTTTTKSSLELTEDMKVHTTDVTPVDDMAGPLPTQKYYFKGVKDHGCRFDKDEPILGGPQDPETYSDPNKYFHTIPTAQSLAVCQQYCIGEPDCTGVEWDYDKKTGCKLWLVMVGYMEEEEGVECFIKALTKDPPIWQYGKTWYIDDGNDVETAIEDWADNGDPWKRWKNPALVDKDIGPFHLGKWGGFWKKEVYDEATNGDASKVVIISDPVENATV